jgi:hypothetical protein
LRIFEGKRQRRQSRESRQIVVSNRRESPKHGVSLLVFIDPESGRAGKRASPVACEILILTREKKPRKFKISSENFE